MSDLELTLRTQAAFELAHRAVGALETYKVWPTPINYELSLHLLAEPDGPLARAVAELLSQGVLHSDDFSDRLAREYLPRVRAQADILETGEALAVQLDRVGDTLGGVAQVQGQLAQALTSADTGIAGATTLPEARAHLSAARGAISTAEREVQDLRSQLSASSAEVERLRALLERGRRDALTDTLTNLPNRRAFDREVEAACARSEDDGSSLTIAMIDIDHFKRFNDTWGHQTGDQVIRYVGSAIGAFAASPRMAARYGGEEFVIILPREDLKRAASLLDDLRAAVAARQLRRRTTSEALGSVTVSIGVAQRKHGEPASSVIERADAALYSSKRNGRNVLTCAPSSPPLHLAEVA